MNYCENCGQTISLDNIFCENCNVKLGRSNPVESAPGSILEENISSINANGIIDKQEVRYWRKINRYAVRYSRLQKLKRMFVIFYNVLFLIIMALIIIFHDKIGEFIMTLEFPPFFEKFVNKIKDL